MACEKHSSDSPSLKDRGGGSLGVSNPCQAALSAPQLISVSNVTASGYQPGNNPENVVDGDVTTTWWASQGMPQWIVLELGTPHLLSESRISFYNYDQGRIYTYSIAVSDDKLNWITVVSNAKSGDSQWTEESFVPINARYVRLTLSSANDSDWANVWEIEVYGVQNAGRSDCGNKTLTLTWNPNLDLVTGYIVYYGRTEDTTTVASDLPIDATGFDPQAPSVTYQSWDGLGLLMGENVCFKLKAYNDAGQSGLSGPACGGI